MKHLILMILFLMGTKTFADSVFGDFGHIDGPTFKSRLYVEGNLYVMDASGKKLLAPTSDDHEWRAGIKSKKIDDYWITKANRIRDVNVHFVIEIGDDNSLSMKITQYESKDGEIQRKERTFGKIIREESFPIENFAPVSWVAETGKDVRVVLRFTPKIEAVREGSLEKLAIGGDRNSFMVTDNQGYLWGDHVRFGGIVVGMNSHRGSFVMSLYPFEGAKEMGTASGKTIELNATDTLKIKIQNDSDLVPGEMVAKVYGRFIPKFKSGSVNSVYSFGQMNADQIPKEFK
jgi:hypothetical protein